MRINRHITLLGLAGITVVAAFLVGIYWNDGLAALHDVDPKAQAAQSVATDKPLLPCSPQDYAQRLNALMAEATLPYRLPDQPVVDAGELHDSMTLQLDNYNSLIVLVDKETQQVATVTLIVNGDQSSDSDASVLLTTAAVAAAALPSQPLGALTPVVAKLMSSYQAGADAAEQTFGGIRLRFDRVPSQAAAWFWVEPADL